MKRTSDGLTLILYFRVKYASLDMITLYKTIRYHLTVIFLLLITIIHAQTWTQVGSDIDGEVDAKIGFYTSLSSDGNIVAVRAASDVRTNLSQVRLYKNISSIWTQIGSDIDGELPGYSTMSCDGTTVAISSGLTTNLLIRIFKNISDKWIQVGEPIECEPIVVAALSEDGSTIAIGSQLNDGNGTNSGHVRIFENLSGTWTQVGADINGEAAGDLSGYSVALNKNGSTVAIGAIYNDGNGIDAGHVRIYKNVSGTWTQVGLDIDGEAADDGSGRSVSLSSDGSIVAIGAANNDGNGIDAGHVRIYKNVSGTWTQVGLDIDGEGEGDYSGIAVSLNIDGSNVAIGAANNDGNGIDAGHVRIYKNVSGTWTQIGSDIDGEAQGDLSGVSVSLSSDGSTVAVGASLNDGNGLNAGHVRIYALNGTSNLLTSPNDIPCIIRPNPTAGALHIQAEDELIGVSYHVYNNSGSEVLQGKIIGKDMQVDLKYLEEGIYYIHIGDNLQQSFKVIKE